MFNVKSSNYGIDIGNLPVVVHYRFEEATTAINDLETFANTLEGIPFPHDCIVGEKVLQFSVELRKNKTLQHKLVNHI